MNGYTKDLSPEEKQQNELASLRQLVQENPGNQYWADRLIALEAKIENDWISKWLSMSHITVKRNPALFGRYVPTDPRTAAEIDRDTQGEEWDETYKDIRAGL